MSFNSLLINHAKVVQITALDKWGEPTETTGPAIPCRIMYGNRLVRDYKGEEVLSVAKLFFKPGHLTFGHEDKLKLDDDGYSFMHPILKVVKPQNSVHIHHGEVYIS